MNRRRRNLRESRGPVFSKQFETITDAYIDDEHLSIRVQKTDEDYGKHRVTWLLNGKPITVFVYEHEGEEGGAEIVSVEKINSKLAVEILALLTRSIYFENLEIVTAY